MTFMCIFALGFIQYRDPKYASNSNCILTVGRIHFNTTFRNGCSPLKVRDRPSGGKSGSTKYERVLMSSARIEWKSFPDRVDILSTQVNRLRVVSLSSRQLVGHKAIINNNSPPSPHDQDPVGVVENYLQPNEY